MTQGVTEDWHGTPGGARRHTKEGTPACEPCLRVRRRRAKQRRMGVRFRLPAAPVWEHVQALREAGLGLPQIAKLSGMAEISVWRVQHQEHVRPETARAILAVPVPAKPDELPDTVYVPAVGSQRRLQALAWQRWAISHLAERTHLPEDTLWCIRAGKRTHVRAETAREIARLFDEIGAEIGPSRRRGGIPASAWDDIDNPLERPKGVA